MTLSASNFCFSELLDGLLEHIFGYLSLNDVSNCARVCKNWNRFLSDENNEIWRYNCLRKLSEKVQDGQTKCQLTVINFLQLFFRHSSRIFCSRFQLTNRNCERFSTLGIHSTHPGTSTSNPMRSHFIVIPLRNQPTVRGQRSASRTVAMCGR